MSRGPAICLGMETLIHCVIASSRNDNPETKEYSYQTAETNVVARLNPNGWNAHATSRKIDAIVDTGPVFDLSVDGVVFAAISRSAILLRFPPPEEYYQMELTFSNAANHQHFVSETVPVFSLCDGRHLETTMFKVRPDKHFQKDISLIAPLVRVDDYLKLVSELDKFTDLLKFRATMRKFANANQPNTHLKAILGIGFRSSWFLRDSVKTPTQVVTVRFFPGINSSGTEDVKLSPDCVTYWQLTRILPVDVDFVPPEKKERTSLHFRYGIVDRPNGVKYVVIACYPYGSLDYGGCMGKRKRFSEYICAMVITTSMGNRWNMVSASALGSHSLFGSGIIRASREIIALCNEINSAYPQAEFPIADAFVRVHKSTDVARNHSSTKKEEAIRVPNIESASATESDGDDNDGVDDESQFCEISIGGGSDEDFNSHQDSDDSDERRGNSYDDTFTDQTDRDSCSDSEYKEISLQDRTFLKSHAVGEELCDRLSTFFPRESQQFKFNGVSALLCFKMADYRTEDPARSETLLYPELYFKDHFKIMCLAIAEIAAQTNAKLELSVIDHSREFHRCYPSIEIETECEHARGIGGYGSLRVEPVMHQLTCVLPRLYYPRNASHTSFNPYNHLICIDSCGDNKSGNVSRGGCLIS